MKVEQIKPEPEFSPVMITLETQEEVDKLFAILDHTCVCQVIGESWWPKLVKFKSNSGWSKYFRVFNECINKNNTGGK